MYKQICFVLTFLLIAQAAVAGEYFVFDVESSIVPYDGEIEISFTYILDGYNGEDFIVRPKISRGSARIFNKKSNKWVSQGDLWMEMPGLEESMKIRVGLSGEAELSFELQNIKDSRIYTTNNEMIRGGDVYGNYLEKINKNLNYQYEERAIKKQTPVRVKQEEPVGFLAKVIKYIGEII